MSRSDEAYENRSEEEGVSARFDETPFVEAGPRRGRRRRWIPVFGVAVLVAGALVWRTHVSEAATPAFRLATVERGDVASSVTATGTLNAVTQVQVGTQVSGQVSAIYVDFNDHVKAGQLIARIDPTLLQQAVSDAEAGVERSQAALLKAERSYDRTKQLYEQQVLTESDFNDVQYARSVAGADAKSAQVALDRARRNLAYSDIHAPIDGVVVERNVDVGQTVAASFSAPQLFLIAHDLGEMEILAAVDESDIGQIRPGQSVSFTVQAYPDTTFTGTVRQVRLQSATTENVVSYTVVVTVANPTGKLLPGMTATVSFRTGSASDVLLVPNAALRYQPSATAVVRRDGPPDGAATPARDSSTSNAEDEGTIWYLTGTGSLGRMSVRVGVSDGRRTEVAAAGLDAGLRVIIGTGTAGSATAGESSPFQTARQAGPPRPGF